MHRPVSLLRRGVLLSAILFLFLPSQAHAQTPDFSASYVPDVIGPGSNSTLTFTIDNTAGASIRGLAFDLTLPAGLRLADAPRASSTCNGLPEFNAVGGAQFFSFSRGGIVGGATCTVSVDVTGDSVGVFNQTTSDLVTDFGNSAPATMTLTVDGARMGFSQVFSPGSVDFGQVSTLTLTYSNNTGSPQFNLFTTETLPDGMVVADPPNVVDNCPFASSTINAGESSFILNGAFLNNGVTCTVSVDVISTEPGENVAVASTLFNSGFASSVLNVGVRPDFFKRFVPSAAFAGSIIELEYTITNRSREGAATGISFTDDLDAVLPGLVAVGPASGCNGGTVSGDSVISFSGGFLAGSDTCTFRVPVQIPSSATAGSYLSTSSDLTNDLGFMAEPASARFSIADGPRLEMDFTTSPLASGDTAQLNLTLTNASTTDTASALAFTIPFADQLPTTIVPQNGVCGGGALFQQDIGGVGTISFSNGTLAPGESCNLIIDFVLPPQGNTSVLLTSSSLSGTLGAMNFASPGDSAALDIVGAPRLQKVITGDPLTGAGSVTFTYTITQSEEAVFSASNIAFSDNLTDVLALTTDIAGPTAACNGGSFEETAGVMSFSGGALDPGESCSFSFNVNVPGGLPPAQYNLPTSDLTADVAGLSVTGNGSSDVLDILSVSFDKEIIGTAVPGGQVTLRYTLSNASTLLVDNLVFTDSISSVLPGLVASDVPATACGATVSGTTFIIFVSGALSPGETCFFDVTLNIPANAVPGEYGSSTGNLSGNFDGAPFVAQPASTVLEVVNPLSISKSFNPRNVLAGDTIDVTYTLTNDSGSVTVENIAFSDDLDAALSGLTAVGLPSAPCGVGSSISGTDTLSFTGGTLAPNDSCDVTVTLQVPAGVNQGTNVVSTTSDVTGTIGTANLTSLGATARFQVEQVLLTKEFVGNAADGGTVTLRYTISAPNAGGLVENISFSEDLDATLSGLAAVSLPADGFCGPGSSASGSSVITISNATAGAGPCDIDILIAIPDGAAAGTYPGSTSQVTSSQDGVNAVSRGASADLIVLQGVELAKAFSPSTVFVGQETLLTFTLTNPNARDIVVSFTDPLPAGLEISGEATYTNFLDSRSTLSAPIGSNLIEFTGNILNGRVDTFTLPVTVTSAGDKLNVTSELLSDLGNTAAATATLQVSPAPGFSTAFAPSSAAVGDAVTLSYTIDNSAGLLEVTDLAFINFLDSNLSVAAAPNVVNGCNGTVTAAAGGNSIDLGGGTVAAGASCTISVEVVGNAVGTFANSAGPLTSIAGDSGVSTTSLRINPAPGFSAAIAPGAIAVDGITTLTLSVDNSGSDISADALSVAVNLPADVTVAGAPNVVSDCGGSVTATAGGGSIDLSGGSLAGGASCSVSVDITAVASGDFTVTTGDLTSSLGNSGNADASFRVDPAPGFSAAIAPAEVFDGGAVTLTYTIDNSGPQNSADALAFSDSLPTGLLLSADGINNGCGGTLTAVSGTNGIALSGGSLAGGASCTITADLTVSGSGTLTTASGDLTSSLGNSGSASASVALAEGPSIALAFTPAQINNGGTSTLSYTLTNNAGISVADLAFSNALPAGVTPATPANATDGCGGALSVVGSTIDFSGGTLAGGASCTISVDVTSDTDGTYTNTVTLNSQAGASAPASADLTVVTGAPADLFVEIKSTPRRPVAGRTAEIKIDVRNSGPNDAENVVVTWVDPPGFTLTDIDGCSGDPCTIPLVRESRRKRVKLTYALASSADDVTFQATATGQGFDPDVSNNIATLDINVRQISNLRTRIRITSLPLGGNPLGINLKVENRGPSDAENVRIVFPIPGIFDNVTWTCSDNSAGATCTASGSDSLEDRADIENGGFVEYDITAFLNFHKTFTATELTAQALIPEGLEDEDLSDNIHTITAGSTSPADLRGELSLVDNASGRLLRNGDHVLLNVLVSNHGQFGQLDDPDSHEFSLDLPAGLELINATLLSDQGSVETDTADHRVRWNGWVEAQDSVLLEVEARIAVSDDADRVMLQGEVFFDADGNGINDTRIRTDNPNTPDLNDAVVIYLSRNVPVLSPAGLLIMVMGLLGTAVYLRRRREADQT